MNDDENGTTQNIIFSIIQHTCHLCPLQTPPLECHPCHHLSCLNHRALGPLCLFCKYSEALSVSL